MMLTGGGVRFMPVPPEGDRNPSRVDVREAERMRVKPI